VSVKEKLTGTFQVGFGFTGGESFFGQAQLAQNNLLGYGHTASLSLQISSIRQLFQLKLPRSPTSGTRAGPARSTSTAASCSSPASTPGQRPARPPPATKKSSRNSAPSSPTRWKRWTWWPRTAPTTCSPTASRAGATSSVRLSFNYDSATTGSSPPAATSNRPGRVRLLAVPQPEPLPALPADRSAIPSAPPRPGLQGQPLARLHPRHRSGDHPVAISEKFFAGGINSVRGYTLRSLSPTQKIANSLEPNAPLIDFPVGGNKEVITNWENRVPAGGIGRPARRGLLRRGQRLLRRARTSSRAASAAATCRWDCSTASGWDCAGSRRSGRCASRPGSRSPAGTSTSRIV